MRRSSPGATTDKPEVWLRGPVEGVAPALQPVAHALLQALEDVERLSADIPAGDVWRQPGDAATIGFHLRHMTGSLDRLLTYARGAPLSDSQRSALRLEKEPTQEVPAEALVEAFRGVVGKALDQLRATSPEELTIPRAVGRAGHPSTVLGLLYHAGEHTARHAGQVATTAKILRAGGGG